MKTLKSYINEAVNAHMEHAEDLVFNLGVEGTRQAILFLRDVRDMLSKGNKAKSGVMTVKWDGAPAVFMGVNPENNKFFVAKKGIFNKNPKLYYSHADIDADTTGDLANKLKVAFTECKKLGLKSGIYQGDILFTKDSLRMEKIDGESYVTFHPNTILYAVPVNSAIGKKILSSNIGIVWHTTYVGSTIDSLNAQFGQNITANFKNTSTAWMEDATFKDVTGSAMFTQKEREAFDQMLTIIGKLFQSMPASVLNAIHKDEDLLGLVHIYNNSKVKAGQTITSVTEHVEGLYQFILERYRKEAESKKTEKGKTAVDARLQKVTQFFSLHPKSEIVKIFELANMIAKAKLALVNKLNKASSIGTFLKTQNGFKVTTPEGYVAISDKGAVKLVDRMEFSMANFSPEIIKGWQR